MNCCTFTGNVSRIGDLKQTSTICFLKFTVAVDRRGKDHGNADFVGFTAFGKTAEFISKWVTVGCKVAVQSHYQQGSYTGQDGKKVYTHDFLVDNIEKMTRTEAPNEEQKTNEPQGFEPIADSLQDEGLPFV